jgi:hypothetical protein
MTEILYSLGGMVAGGGLVWIWFYFRRPSLIRHPLFSSRLSEAEIAGAFRVDENATWFQATLGVIDALERELITESRAYVGETNKCINAVGGGAALEVLRTRLENLRAAAVKGREEAPAARTSSAQRPTSNVQ